MSCGGRHRVAITVPGVLFSAFLCIIRECTVSGSPIQALMSRSFDDFEIMART
jgi:hypothetical protein